MDQFFLFHIAVKHCFHQTIALLLRAAVAQQPQMKEAIVVSKEKPVMILLRSMCGEEAICILWSKIKGILMYIYNHNCLDQVGRCPQNTKIIKLGQNLNSLNLHLLLIKPLLLNQQGQVVAAVVQDQIAIAAVVIMIVLGEKISEDIQLHHHLESSRQNKCLLPLPPIHHHH